MSAAIVRAENRARVSKDERRIERERIGKFPVGWSAERRSSGGRIVENEREKRKEEERG